MTARDSILAALAPAAPLDPAALASEAAALVQGLEHPPAPAEAPDQGFLASLSLPSVAATHDWVPDWPSLPMAVRRYFAAIGESARIYLPPDPRLSVLDWAAVDRLSTCPIDGGAALAIALAGVAETGSLVLETAPQAPMLPNFLALHHLVALERGTIVRWLEELPPAAPGARTRTWVTGVSGTTDIEGQYVRGAHGPRFLHVILIG